MVKNKATMVVCVLALAALASSTGCSTNWSGPSLGLWNYPIPVSPWLQDKEEDAFIEHKKYERAPILGPLAAGAPTAAMDEPSDDEVMRKMEEARPIEGGIPFLHEVQWKNVKIVKEPIADYIDPVRVYPLVGPAQLHHAHYKCVVYFTEVTRVGWPVPYTTYDEDAQEVIYIDHDHLHMAGNVNPGPGSNYPEPIQ